MASEPDRPGYAVNKPPSRGARVLVTDGEQRSSLAAVRALGRAGYWVSVTANRKGSLAARSRFCMRGWRVSAPLTDPEQYADDIAAIVARQAIDVVLPMTEPSLLVLLPTRERLSPAAIPFGDHRSFLQLLDKDEVLRRAPAHGIPVPQQIVLEKRSEVQRADVDELHFPVVLKPGRSVGVTGGRRQSVGVQHVSRRSCFVATVRELPAASFPLLVQERIEGHGVGIFLLLGRSGVLARFAHRRLREKPPTGGVSVLRESIKPDEDLFERAQDLLEEFGWEGVAMVEFKVSDESGEPYLMEVNPRLWGSLQLAIDAGVDFPTLMVRAALGEAVPASLTYSSGVRTRWLWGEIDHWLARTKAALNREGSTRPMQVAADAMGAITSELGRGSNLETLDWSDPRPFLRESVDWVRELLSGGRD